MDAVEYLKYRRLLLPTTTTTTGEIHIKVVRVPCKLKKKPPRKTNRQKFWEVFGFDPFLHTNRIHSKADDGLSDTCYLSEWWRAEYKEPEA